LRQPQDFQSVAKRLECDMDEERFREKLGKIAREGRDMRKSVGVLSVLACCAALAISAEGAPQSATPSVTKPVVPPETVIVTGPRPAKEERNKIVWDFVYAHAKLTPKIDQLARWRWNMPVCPEVKNLPAAYAAFITKRIKNVAQAVGAPVKEPCKTDIQIIFTSNPQAFMDGVAKDNPKFLGFHFLHDTEKVATVTKDIQAWYVTATSNEVATYVDDPYHSPPSGTAGSRLSHGQLSVFINVLIVADATKVAGYPVGQVADYLAMLSLSQADAPTSCLELPSILDLMSPDCPASKKPDSLTAADKAYLQGLYAMDPEEIGSLQRSGIANFMKRESANYWIKSDI
ncbi:MAG: hypothetical protein WB709_03710, partial [Solirubrobacteraceae bacterium]